MNQQLPINPLETTPPKDPSSARAIAAALFTVFVWAMSFPLTKIALVELQPLPLAAARFALAAALILAWLAWKRPALPSPGDTLRFLACGSIGIALYNALLNAGQQSVSASAASFIVNTVPIITALLAVALLKERFTRWGWVGSAIGLAGIGVIVAGQPGDLSFGEGAPLIFGSAVAQAAYFVIQRPLIARYGALTATAYSLLAGSVMLAPWMVEGLGVLANPATHASTIVAVIALAIFPAVLGYAAWAFAIGHFGAARCANLLYLVPPTATVLAFTLSGEVPGPATLLGGLIAVAGVALVNAKGRP